MSGVMTLQKLARLAGVTPSTVSRVLNPATRHLISAEQCEHILNLCDKHAYRPSLTGRSFVTGKTYKVALILGSLERDLFSPTFSFFIRGLCAGLQSADYSLSILWAGQEPGVLALDRQVERFLMSSVADAYVLGNTLLNRQILDRLKQVRRPVVGLDLHHVEKISAFSYISFDNFNACEEILGGLEKEELQNFCFYGHTGTNTLCKYQYFVAAAKKLEVDSSNFNLLTYEPEFLNILFDRSHACFFAEKNWQELCKAKVIACASDMTAMGLMDFMKRKGIKVGEDIKVIGHDNLKNTFDIPDFAELATIDPNMEEAGKTTAKILLGEINSKKERKNFQKKIAGSFIERNSAKLRNKQRSTK
jgi:LacI family transcriptional regulator